MTNLPEFFRCGCCDHFHSVNFWGDCRQDDQRFTEDDLEEKYGKEHEGWLEVEQP